MPKFPHYQQHDETDCGPTCLRMLAKYHGKNIPLSLLRSRSHTNRQGSTLSALSHAAETIGLRTMIAALHFDTLRYEAPLPCIVHWQQNHFVVVYEISRKHITIADPEYGIKKLPHNEFIKAWTQPGSNGEEPQGGVLLAEPTPDFFAETDELITDKTGFGFLWNYIKRYKQLLGQLIIGLFAASLLQLIFPFLTQALVDVGVMQQNISFVYMVLAAQLLLFAGRTAIEFIRSRILLHFGTRVNIALVADFLSKLMRLPIGFFDERTTGDLLQRIDDHRRIENFMTVSSLSTLFSTINLLVFGAVLLYYSPMVFAVFAAGTLLHILWVLPFMKKRRQLDHQRFDRLNDHQSKLLQLLGGIREIKLNNDQTRKRHEWERVQASLFRVNLRSLSLEQYQQGGGIFINELKNILITFLAAQQVIQGNLTLGMLMAVSYIIGQLNSPVSQLLAFFKAAQDAKISLERMGEIHTQKDEHNPDAEKSAPLPDGGDIHIQNLTFGYGAPDTLPALQNVSFSLPHGKITALVGASGGGKSTLIKLLLKFYEARSGTIKINDYNLTQINNDIWRKQCGVVMQNGFVFSDTILGNITLNDEQADGERLMQALRISNLPDVLENLPEGLHTKIGEEGLELSGGQKQRVLIARAIYKNPRFLFFDEATNALDAENERIIMQNLQAFFKGKTVLIAAHRLSTVQNAHQIVVLHKGEVVEVGTHQSLLEKKGVYYNLVKNQLDRLGS